MSNTRNVPVGDGQCVRVCAHVSCPSLAIPGGAAEITRAPCVGLVLPVLGALPDALIIIVSGLGGSREEVAQQVPLFPTPYTPTRILTRSNITVLWRLV